MPQVDAGVQGATYNSDSLKGRGAGTAGTISDPSFNDNGSGNLIFPRPAGGGYFNYPQAAMLMFVYFIAPQTGVNTIQPDMTIVDDWNYLWLGVNAYYWQSGYQNYQSIRAGSGLAPYKDNLNATSFTVNQGDAVPITLLWVNGGGPGASDYSVTTPDGVKRSLSGLLAPPCDKGNRFTT